MKTTSQRVNHKSKTLDFYHVFKKMTLDFRYNHSSLLYKQSLCDLFIYLLTGSVCFRTKDATKPRWLFQLTQWWCPLCFTIIEGGPHVFLFWINAFPMKEKKSATFPNLCLKKLRCAAPWQKIQRAKNTT